MNISTKIVKELVIENISITVISYINSAAIDIYIYSIIPNATQPSRFSATRFLGGLTFELKFNRYYYEYEIEDNLFETKYIENLIKADFITVENNILYLTNNFLLTLL